METFVDWAFWIVLLVMFILLAYVPRWTARRQRKQQESELEIGDQVLTIGGLMGTLVYFNPDENLARVRIADGVIVDMLPGAISGKRGPEVGEQAHERDQGPASMEQ